MTKMENPRCYSSAISVFLFSLFHVLSAQQTYVNNAQLNCYGNDSSTTLGYVCSNSSSQKSCNSYLTFRSRSPYSSAVTIGYLLKADAKEIAKINNITEVDDVSDDTLITVPVSCSCSGNYYQHNSNYTLNANDTYLIVANNTYEGLTTCQALMNQNPYDSRNLKGGMEILVPLRCACPSRNQTRKGVRFLLTYLVTRGNDIPTIAESFGVNPQDVRDANTLSSASTIFPFTPLLIPLKTELTTAPTGNSPPPPESKSPPPVNPVPVNTNSKRKGVFVGVGVGAGVVLILAVALCIWFFLWRHRRPSPPQDKKPSHLPSRRRFQHEDLNKKFGESFGYPVSDGAREVIESLTVYKFNELERATGSFSEDHRIKGSVYCGVINGDNAAIKRFEGDVSDQINILKQVSHSNVIRLSGFCLHEGNTYLVYEFAENGSLSDWLNKKKYGNSSILNWKQRVQIAYDVADGLNYLHNYANPPYIHKDLKSSNILLDANLRAKVANFGLARLVSVQDSNEGGGLQMTRHVVGTKGYMAPEYLEHGLVTPKLDVFAMGVVLLELLSGGEAATTRSDEEKGEDLLLWTSIKTVMEGDNVRGKLKSFIDPSLQQEYPLDLAFSMAQLATNCVAHDLNSRPTMVDVFVTLSKILSSSLDWDPSDVSKSGSQVALGR